MVWMHNLFSLNLFRQVPTSFFVWQFMWQDIHFDDPQYMMRVGTCTRFGSFSPLSESTWPSPRTMFIEYYRIKLTLLKLLLTRVVERKDLTILNAQHEWSYFENKYSNSDRKLKQLHIKKYVTTYIKIISFFQQLLKYFHVLK